MCKNILYFESKGRQVRVYERGGKTQFFNGKLSHVEEVLRSGKIPFMRVHQSYLVNYLWIKSRTNNEIVLITDERIPISEDRRRAFNKQYGQVLRGELCV